MKKEMNNKGFSLVELIIVIAIMAVLMGVLAPQFIKYVESSRKQKDASACSEVENAAQTVLSIESVYRQFVGASGKVTVTVHGAGGAPTSTLGGSFDTELQKVIPSTPPFTSRRFGNADQTITIEMDGSDTFKITNTYAVLAQD